MNVLDPNDQTTVEPEKAVHDRQASLPAKHLRAVWTLRLWGLSAPGHDLVLTLAVVLLLAWSRFAFLASGPWEWDETLFARGVLEFDLAAHFPHPPGFPLWILLGRLVNPFVSEPLKGLQILSALASVLTLWPLAALGRRLAPPCVATAAAVCILFAPGVWLHAPRGFTSTPAAFFALWAAAVAVWGLEGRRATAFTLLVTAAFLIRPILLPSFGLLWLAGALTVRPPKRLLPGVLAAAAAGAAAIGWMVTMQGSWTKFITPFFVHGTTHARNLVVNQGSFPDWGIVKGLGGVWVATGIAVLALAGIVVWWRRCSRFAAASWVLVLGIGVWQIIAIQNRTFPRYAVPFQLALAPLVATAAATLAPPGIAVATLLGLGAVLGTQSYEVVDEQHTMTMPGWDAVRFAVDQAQQRRLDLVVEGGLHPFLAYHEAVERSRGHVWSFKTHLTFTSSDAGGVPVGGFLLVTDFPDQYFGPLAGPSRSFALVSDALIPFTQRRFLRCWVAENPALPLDNWYLMEESRALGRFRWGRTGARLLLPPVPPGTVLAIEVAPARGPAPLPVHVGARPVAELKGRAPRTAVRLAHELLSATSTTMVTFPRAQAYVPTAGRETRELTIQLFACRLRHGPALPLRVEPANAPDLADAGGHLEGVWKPERFAGLGGIWTQPVARLWLPVGEGTLRLRVAAPRPTPAQLEVTAGGRRLAGPFDPPSAPTWLEIPLPGHDPATGGLDLELRSVGYSPARAGHGSDRRELGVVLFAAEYVPAHPIPRAFPTLPDRLKATGYRLKAPPPSPGGRGN